MGARGIKLSEGTEGQKKIFYERECRCGRRAAEEEEGAKITGKGAKVRQGRSLIIERVRVRRHREEQ